MPYMHHLRILLLRSFRPVLYARHLDDPEFLRGVSSFGDFIPFVPPASSFVFLKLCNTLFDHEFQDINWVHLWRRSIFEQIDPKSRGVFFLEEILVHARQLGLTIAEVRSAYRPRQGGTAKGGHPIVIIRTIWDMLALWAETR